ncbi:MAG: diphthine synthase [Candidatus Thermoplasmatota archaeon]|nr:diphthine synthase [Euryarchaeota archaeon]MBU4031666.1 diphthine synthase [Candidatus Thermoplasmatota archaeon]MBU4071275.1 diphthine synthase [Candidatus Thermoplasmatota archaeon]MBU4144327.1 diphthine synthase [Candidatus Thermoplasmatota archaeon]MBU4591923.1 diphthine synthase [Candidatus Thermoplasmatota archaeon]
MAKLIFIGLGLGNEKGITLNGLETARSCDSAFMESYTSILEEGSVPKLEEMFGKKIHILDREGVETGMEVLEHAAREDVCFLVPGDAMSATTHVDMRLRAHALGIPTEIIGGVSAFTAIPAMLGLQNYKFGRTITVPIPEPNFNPTSFYERAHDNFKMGMHTLCLLDIQKDRGRFMTANQALEVLAIIEEDLQQDFMTPDRLVCVVARAGSEDCLAKAGYLKDMLKQDFGPPLHSIVIPGDLHFLEAKALVELAGAPAKILTEE